MIPREVLDTVPLPDGGTMVLAREAGAFVIRVDGRALMSSRVHGSEEALAREGCAGLRERVDARVLVGGLGLGYTLRAALDQLGGGATVVVAEIVPAVVAWNRGPLAPLAGHPLDDARATVIEADVAQVLRTTLEPFDAILLDVDNGPLPMARAPNQWLYSAGGLAAIRRALRRPGTLVVWSATGDAPFERRLRQAGFAVEVRTVSARGDVKKGARHTLLLARVA